jgi:predicted hotdog family 3-hydroxylacyl-ACP dehydratase
MIPRDTIAELIPHGGAMCLLDTIVSWDHDGIVCHSARHVAVDNPLREGGRLPAIHAIEFAAQAMAAHQRLLGPDGARPGGGLLVSVRQCKFPFERLDRCESPLVIEARRLAGSADAITYSFAVGAAGGPTVSGRATVMLTSGGAE